MKHQLIIHCLHDAQASCTCGKWQFIRTGAATREELQAEWQRHVDWKKSQKISE